MTDLDQLIHDALTLSLAALRRTRDVDKIHFEAELAVEHALEAIKSASQTGGDWSVPTSYVKRFTHALSLLCRKAPPPDAVEAWLAPDSDDTRLQEFAVEHGPAWAQGIAVIDAAQLLASMPTEGVDHEIIEINKSTGWELDVAPEAIADLLRFQEMCLDDEDYDAPKERMRHLAKIGLVSRVSGNIYEITDFGRSIASVAADRNVGLSN